VSGSGNFRYFNFLHPLKLWKDRRAISILVSGVILTILASIYMEHGVENRANIEFASVCNEINTEISNRLHAHAQLLQSGSSLFAASDSVTRQNWKTFFEHSKLTTNLTGIQGYGFSLIIKKNGLQEHINRLRKEGFPDYSVRPAGERDIYTSIIYLEPFTGINTTILGYDMFSEPVRRQAMEVSRDSDLVVLSGKITFVNETGKDLQACLLMFVPVYQKGKSVITVSERREAIIGWVCSPHRINELMDGILGHWGRKDFNRIRLLIYDRDSISAKSLLFDSQYCEPPVHDISHSRQLILPLVFNSNKWTLCFSQSDERFLFFKSKSVILFISGIAISFLLFVLYLSLLNTKSDAKQIAEKLTSELRDSENRYRSLINWTPEAIAVHRNGILIYANPAAIKAIGANSAEDVVGRSFIELVHPDDRKSLIDGMIKVAGGGIDEQRVIRKFIRLDGKVIDVDIRATLIIYDGQPAIYSTMRDVTASNQMEIELRKSKDQYSSLISNIPIGVYRLRRFTNGSYTFEYVSPIMEELINVSTERIMADPYAAFAQIHPEDLDSLRKLNQERFENPLPFDWEGRVVIREKEKWIKIASAPALQENGDVIWNGVVADINDRKLVELELTSKNEELIRANAEKDKFFSIIAHDLRSPFNGFLGLTQMMSEELLSLSSEDVQKIAVTLRSSATNLYRLIENLLYWASMKQGLIPFHPELLNLLQVVKESTATVLEHARNKEIELVYKIDDDLNVFADSNILQTIIRNLVSNAVKFTPKDGTISLSAKINNEKAVEVSVKDNGIGMRDEMIRNMFRINEQTNRQGTEGESSTGLGLILCKEFIEKHGGRIWVDSVEGKGSVFYFTLPGEKT
jgi:PAS domain S-box-containing protein